MAFRGLKLFSIISERVGAVRYASTSSFLRLSEAQTKKPNEYKTEDNFVYLEDPDTFGTLSGRVIKIAHALEDKGDIKEQDFLENIPVSSQKLTIKQYADLIKQYLKYKRIKEAIDILEVRMKQDRVKPENYIYNILIGACADVGYTRKAFKLFNDMKRRALKTTGDTYTCLFEACANSPWAADGLKNALHLKRLMIEKGIQPNLTNYNAMIKAFGRCGDITTAFQIVDEMRSNKMKIRVHTFNHLLHACISDKNTGLRHALIVWRKMLQMREKPNIYSFNLMLKCVKECNLGTKEDIEELLGIIHAQMLLAFDNKSNRVVFIEGLSEDMTNQEQVTQTLAANIHSDLQENKGPKFESDVQKITNNVDLTQEGHNQISVTQNVNVSGLQFVEKLEKPVSRTKERTVPNLLSKVLNLQQVLSLQEVKTAQEKFAVVGGQDDFLHEMEVYSLKPDIKTFTQMLHLVEETREAEQTLIETMKTLKIKTDIDFYNMLIKKRCLRSDYEGAFEVMGLIKQEGELREKGHPMSKKSRFNVNVMTYGVLAMACKTKESADKLLNEMKEKQIKVNIEILGALLKHATVNKQFGYVIYILNLVKEENLKVNEMFIKHLETFNDKCASIVKQDESSAHTVSEKFIKSFKKFLEIYGKWLKEVNVEEALQHEHPWQQFQGSYPETVQKNKFQIVEPKKFYKKNRKYVPYTPRI